MLKVLADGIGFATTTKDVEFLSEVSARPIHFRRKTSPILPVSRKPRSIPVQGISRSIEVKIASTENEWEQAFELAASSYQARGYETPGAARLRFTPYHALPDTLTLIAKHDERVVATLSVVMDNVLLGLPMEDIYPDEIAALRLQNRRLAETTTLADDGLSIREFIQVFISLIQLAMQHHRRNGGDTPVIVVNPRHRHFYTKMLGFVPMGTPRSYSAVQDHLAEAFWVDYDLFKVNAPKIYKEIFSADLPHEVLYAPKMPRRLVRKFSRQSSLCNPEEIEHILRLRKQYGSMRRW
jgi:hypothetical protein